MVRFWRQGIWVKWHCAGKLSCCWLFAGCVLAAEKGTPVAKIGVDAKASAVPIAPVAGPGVPAQPAAARTVPVNSTPVHAPAAVRPAVVVPTTRRAQAAHAVHRQGGNIRSAKRVVSWLAAEEEGMQQDAAEGESWLLKEDSQGFTNLALVFLVTTFVVFGVTALCCLVLALRHDGADDSRPNSSLVFYYILMFITTSSALCYYSMYSEVAVVHKQEGGEVRTLFPAQYIEWAVTSPLSLLALALLGNAPWTSIFSSVGCDLIM